MGSVIQYAGFNPNSDESKTYTPKSSAVFHNSPLHQNEMSLPTYLDPSGELSWSNADLKTYYSTRVQNPEQGDNPLDTDLKEMRSYWTLPDGWYPDYVSSTSAPDFGGSPTGVSVIDIVKDVAFGAMGGSGKPGSRYAATTFSPTQNLATGWTGGPEALPVQSEPVPQYGGSGIGWGNNLEDPADTSRHIGSQRADTPLAPLGYSGAVTADEVIADDLTV